MSILPTDDAIARFKANEERVDIFVNDPLSTGYYTTNETVPRQVKTLPELESVILESASLRADLASDAPGKGDALIAVKQPFTGAVARTQHNKNAEWVSVLDFGADRTGATDSTAAFQNAARAVNGVSGAGAVPGGTVFVPNGTYLCSTIGIRGTVFVGENREHTIVKGYGTGAASDYMFNAQLDMDGTTANTNGGGWVENMTIDANGCGRSLVRTYGGGCTPQKLTLKNASASGATGLSMGLPIWATVSNVYAVNCARGFFTDSGPGDNGTSLTMIDCWADSCGSYGFHITQLYYSSFINCVAQDCGAHNWYIQGNANGISAVYSLQFYGCATEGSGTPFYFKDGREFTVINPRIINPTSGVDLITFDNVSGSIIDFSTPSALSGGAYHLNVLNNNSGTGSVKLIGGNVTIDPTDGVATHAVAKLGPDYGNLTNTKTTDYTLNFDDAGKTVILSGSGSGLTFTIPSYTSVYYPVGTEITVINRTASDMSIACSDTMLLAGTFTTGTRTLAGQSVAKVRKVDAAVWIISGDGGTLS